MQIKTTSHSTYPAGSKTSDLVPSNGQKLIDGFAALATVATAIAKVSPANANMDTNATIYLYVFVSATSRGKE